MFSFVSDPIARNWMNGRDPTTVSSIFILATRERDILAGQLHAIRVRLRRDRVFLAQANSIFKQAKERDFNTTRKRQREGDQGAGGTVAGADQSQAQGGTHGAGDDDAEGEWVFLSDSFSLYSAGFS